MLFIWARSARRKGSGGAARGKAMTDMKTPQDVQAAQTRETV